MGFFEGGRLNRGWQDSLQGTMDHGVRVVFTSLSRLRTAQNFCITFPVLYVFIQAIFTVVVSPYVTEGIDPVCVRATAPSLPCHLERDIESLLGWFCSCFDNLCQSLKPFQ
jgi:hypothetical protein